MTAKQRVAPKPSISNFPWPSIINPGTVEIMNIGARCAAPPEAPSVQQPGTSHKATALRAVQLPRLVLPSSPRDPSARSACLSCPLLATCPRLNASRRCFKGPARFAPAWAPRLAPAWTPRLGQPARTRPCPPRAARAEEASPLNGRPNFDSTARSTFQAHPKKCSPRRPTPELPYERCRPTPSCCAPRCGPTPSCTPR